MAGEAAVEAARRAAGRVEQPFRPVARGLLPGKEGFAAEALDRGENEGNNAPATAEQIFRGPPRFLQSVRHR